MSFFETPALKPNTAELKPETSELKLGTSELKPRCYTATGHKRRKKASITVMRQQQKRQKKMQNKPKMKPRWGQTWAQGGAKMPPKGLLEASGGHLGAEMAPAPPAPTPGTRFWKPCWHPLEGPKLAKNYQEAQNKSQNPFFDSQGAKKHAFGPLPRKSP